MTAIPDMRLPPRQRGLFAYSNWDAVAVLAGLAHLAFVIWIVVGFEARPWWGNLLCGLAYAYAAAWNINSVAHNFIHTPYFRWGPLNYAFSLVESLALATPQRFYTWVHLRHHQGNSDRPGPDGQTLDWLSIYRHGKDGRPEPVWSYVLKGAFRGDAGDIHATLKAKRPFDAAFGRFELISVAAYGLGLAVLDWKAVLFLVPFYYLGECVSQLNGYYEHFGADPDKPIAWGVSTYAPLYNFLWFNNGHPAEHHFRPAVHWTRLPAFRRAIEGDQAGAGLHVIDTPHALGFLAAANRKRTSSQKAAV